MPSTRHGRGPFTIRSGADLAAARKIIGLTQRKLAQELGVPQATISRWETGAHPIERPKMLSLALAEIAPARRT